jgi:hypothetical protein
MYAILKRHRIRRLLLLESPFIFPRNAKTKAALVFEFKQRVKHRDLHFWKITIAITAFRLERALCSTGGQ